MLDRVAVAAGVIALALLACKEKRKSAPPPTPVATAEAATKTTPAGLERGEIQAGKDAAGLTRRAIVRRAPEFGAAEVTRLESGTPIGIVQQLTSGWLEIRWPYPSGSNAGYVHKDVVSFGTAEGTSSTVPASRPGGPCPPARQSTTLPCRCSDGRVSSMVCLGRSLTWSACDCGQRPNAIPSIQPDQRGFCQKDSDCKAPYRCGFQGNCMLL